MIANSRNCSMSKEVVRAVFNSWAKKNLSVIVDAWLQDCSPVRLLNRTPSKIGKEFLEDNPRSFSEMTASLLANETARSCLEYAAKTWEGIDNPCDMQNIFSVLLDIFKNSIGEHVVVSGWFKIHEDAIKSHKKNVKVINQVHSA